MSENSRAVSSSISTPGVSLNSDCSSRSFFELQFAMAFVVDSELLIPEVEKYPCLYDTNREDYQDRNEKTRAWRNIAEVLNPELQDFERTAYIRELQRRWKCIRDACLKSLKRTKHFVGGKKPRRMKQYVYMKLLKFILPFLEIPNQKTQIDCHEDSLLVYTPAESNEYPGSDDEEIKYSSTLAKQQKDSQDSNSDSSYPHILTHPSTSTNDSLYNLRSSQNTRKSRSSNRRRSVMSDEVHSDPSQPFILNLRNNGYTEYASAHDQSSLLEISPSSSPSHRFDLLCKNWCEKMKTLPNDQRIFAEKLINDVFYEAELNRLGNGCRIVVSS